MNISGSGNYTFETIGGTYRFVSPYRKEWLRIVTTALAAVFLAWFLWPSNWGLLFDVGVQPVSLVMLVVTGIFAVIVGLMVLETLWQLLGKEVMEVSDEAVVIRHLILGIGLSRRVPADKVSGLVASSPDSWRSVWSTRRDYRFFNFQRGWVALSGGQSMWGRAATYRFGTSLDEGEAAQVVTLIAGRFPQYTAASRQADGKPGA